MIKYLLLIIVTLGLITCNTKTDNDDYFGQTTPDTIPIIFAEDIISIKGRLEHGISFTPDGQEFAFGVLNKHDFSGVIFYSKKENNAWEEPTVFEPLKNESVFLPYFTPDGKSLLYGQSRPDTNNGLTDIWIINKEPDGWSSPQKISSPISSLSRESSACLTLDKKIYFASNRDGNGLADLYASSMENAEYLNVELLSALSTVRDEESIFISPDDTYTIFCRYATDQNGPDLYISYRDIRGNWIQPVHLDSSINSKNWERRPFVTIDNKYLFFTRLIFEEQGLSESDIYWVNTKKVFKPFIYNPISDTIVRIGENINIVIPTNYFKDIDDENLSFKVNLDKIDWLEFDKDDMILKGKSTQVGEFDIMFTAVDEYSNMTEDKIKIKVKK
jgi:hypothetical protein